MPGPPAPKRIHSGLICSAGHAWQVPSTGLLGQGSAHWAVTVRVDHWAKQGCQDGLPFLPTALSHHGHTAPAGH